MKCYLVLLNPNPYIAPKVGEGLLGHEREQVCMIAAVTLLTYIVCGGIEKIRTA
jgi:hypothetical protein